MASPHPHPDNERERFPVPWEDDDAPGLSVHPLSRADAEAILASVPDEPDDEPPLRLPSLRKAAAARRRQRRAIGTPGASAQAEYQRRRADGERQVARLLEPLVRAGWAVSHDLRIPGSKANVDHLVTGPPGVFAIDTKNYRGRLRLSPDGLLWHGRTLLLPTLSATRWE